MIPKHEAIKVTLNHHFEGITDNNFLAVYLYLQGLEGSPLWDVPAEIALAEDYMIRNVHVSEAFEERTTGDLFNQVENLVADILNLLEMKAAA